MFIREITPYKNKISLPAAAQYEALVCAVHVHYVWPHWLYTEGGALYPVCLLESHWKEKEKKKRTNKKSPKLFVYVYGQIESREREYFKT